MSHIKLNFGLVRTRCERAGGFTLIEVMITVAIVAILAAVALPAYSDYVMRSKISEAISSLSDMRTRLEQFYLDNRAYPTGPGQCKTSGADPLLGEINLPAKKYFVVTCTAMSTTAYTITATGEPLQGMSTDFKYTINESNARASEGPGGHYTNPTCWATRKNGDC
jgi:type IV pilus assembly protein PilE